MTAGERTPAERAEDAAAAETEAGGNKATGNGDPDGDDGEGTEPEPAPDHTVDASAWEPPDDFPNHLVELGGLVMAHLTERGEKGDNVAGLAGALHKPRPTLNVVCRELHDAGEVIRTERAPRKGGNLFRVP